MLVWAPLAGGLLTGKHRRDAGPPEGTRQFAGWKEPPIRDEGRLWRIVEALIEIAQEMDVSPAQVALAWTLGRPAVTSVIVGARTPDQLEESLGCAEIGLSDEARETLDGVSAPELPYPYWHQVHVSERFGGAERAFLQWHVERQQART